ncbi:MAG: hypothetical protein AB4050_01820 [Synechococcus sp.]
MTRKTDDEGFRIYTKEAVREDNPHLWSVLIFCLLFIGSLWLGGTILNWANSALDKIYQPTADEFGRIEQRE